MRYVSNLDDQVTEHAEADREAVSASQWTVDDAGVEHVVDAGGVLTLFVGDAVVATYPAGEWRACSEHPPPGFVSQGG